jgi:hypothetical protein
VSRRRAELEEEKKVANISSSVPSFIMWRDSRWSELDFHATTISDSSLERQQKSLILVLCMRSCSSSSSSSSRSIIMISGPASSLGDKIIVFR